ncbi:MAG: 50S ribosomal protein L24, partial [Bacilli bacterium]
GKNKGATGNVLKVVKDRENTNNTKVIVEGVNVVKKHVKPNHTNQTGGIISMEAPIHISNVKLEINEKKKSEKKTK